MASAAGGCNWSFNMAGTKSLLSVAIMFLLPIVCRAQTTPPPNNQVFGISVNPEGSIQFREADARSELAKIKARRGGGETAAAVRKRPRVVSRGRVSGELRDGLGR